MSGIKPALTVVVIGRNEGERLVRCLASVRAMQPVQGGHEVIYVDSDSTDNSLQVASDMGARTLSVNSRKPTAAQGRNTGWRAAAGEWILFLDGDTILHPGFASEAIRQASSDERIAAVWGHRRELRPTANFFHRVLDLDWVYAPGLTEFCGGDALMRRSSLEQCGGFDESLIAGEEPELCARLRAAGRLILHVDAPMTQHDLAISHWKQYWSRASRAGYAYAQMAWKTRHAAVRLWAGEARGNAVRSAVLLALLALPLAVPAAFPWNLLLLAALALRSAYRSRWKSTDRATLILYGFHSHLQQLPILAGQICFWWDLSRNRHRELIAYK